MVNPIYNANLGNLKQTFQNIQDDSAIITKVTDVELTLDTWEDRGFPLIFAHFSISDLVRLREDLSSDTDSMHQQVCRNAGRLIKKKKKNLDDFFKNHGLIPFPTDSFSEQGSFTLVYAQNPRIHSYDWIFDQEEDLYFPRNHLLVNERVRNAAFKSGFKPTLDDNCRLILTKELYENLNDFLTHLQPFFPNYNPIVPTFEQYQKFWDWAKTNDPKFFNSFADIKELVRHNQSYKLAYCTDNKPELEEIHLSLHPLGKLRIAEIKNN